MQIGQCPGGTQVLMRTAPFTCTSISTYPKGSTKFAKISAVCVWSSFFQQSSITEAVIVGSSPFIAPDNRILSATHSRVIYRVLTLLDQAK